MFNLFGLLLLGALCAAPALAQRGGEKVPLNILWRVKVGSTDLMSTPNWSEASQFSFQGATYYVPENSATGRAIFYRLYNGSTDHMDSATAGEGGYTTEGGIGYPYTTQEAGTEAMARKYDSSNGDHGLGPQWESISGYSNEIMSSSFGYPRYLNMSLSLLVDTAGGVTVKSNGVAGGAVWEWWWNNMQFVNDCDYGREIQSALFFTDENGVTCNPTEAGDAWTAQSNPGQRHGSPILNIQDNGNQAYQLTRCIPLEWSPENHGGGSNNPVLWKDIRMGKDLYLNYNSLGAVAKYSTYLYTPTLLPSAQMEIPTGYLRASFNRYYTYDATTRVLTEVYPPADNGQSNVGFTPSFGGVIVSDSTQNYAQGVYGASTSQGGSVSYFTLWNFTNLGGSGGQYDGGCVKWSAVYGPADIPAGTKTFNSYICTGTLSGVTGQMDSLYAAGAL